MVIVFVLICLVFVLLMVEARSIRRSTESISTRIQVNGTRGKSSITEYITIALRATGMKVQGKVTGEVPALIGPDGTRNTIRRRGPARIQEQFRIIHQAARAGTEILVLECMSIDPALQETESRYFRPHIYVLSNIRDDHREKMGRTRKEQVAAMCSAIPRGCILVSGDRENLEAIRTEALRKKCILVLPEALDPEIDHMIPSGIFIENITLAVEAAVQAGAVREVALKSILNRIGESEAKISGAELLTGSTPFLNAFSVNDPVSATAFLDSWKEKLQGENKMVLIFNTRSDRPLRTEMFSEWIMEQKERIAGVCITGDHRIRAYSKLKALEPMVRICKIGPGRIKGLPDYLNVRFGMYSAAVGIGNIKGEGYRVIKEFDNGR